MRALAGGNPFTLSSWSYDWTVFYWAVWMAWAPITAIFLGQIAYGRTIRDFLLMNLLLPALFSAIWMGVFSGATLHLELTQHTGFSGIIKASGAEAASYTMFRQLPLAGLLIPTFVVISFLSFVSGADANTTAMAAISQKNMTQTNQEPSNALKIVWGLLIGIVSWIMVSQSDLDGIRMLSNLGGLPVLFLEMGCIVSLGKLCFDSFKKHPQK
jgi:glycine betaine transporter